MRSQLAAALHSLQGLSPSDADVHAARKCIKRARASLRLLREVLGRAVYQRENKALRDAGRPLSPARDAKILLDVLQSLAEQRAIDADATQSLRRALSRHRSELQRRALARHEIVAVRRILRATDRRVRDWPFTGADESLLIRALRRVYRRGRDAMTAARENPNAQALHEWRKQVKYLWHELQLLPAKQANAALRSDTAHKLADHLGNDHDLSVLHDYVLARRKLMSRAAARTLTAEIEKRRLALEKKAFTLGRRPVRGQAEEVRGGVSKTRPPSLREGGLIGEYRREKHPVSR